MTNIYIYIYSLTIAKVRRMVETATDEDLANFIDTNAKHVLIAKGTTLFYFLRLAFFNPQWLFGSHMMKIPYV